MGSRVVTFLVAAGLIARGADQTKTVLDGVYSADQAERGQSAYTAHCASCHLDDLTAYRGALHGIAFSENFQGDSLERLFLVTKNTMPRNTPGSLPEETYLDIIAYVLQENLYPSGSLDLKRDSLKSIQIVGKAGSETVPNFTLVAVVGCLMPGPGDSWMLTGATEPAKTRNPDAARDEELTAYMQKSPETRTYQLLEAGDFRAASHKGNKMAAKGFLVKHSDGDQIHLTLLQVLAETCTP